MAQTTNHKFEKALDREDSVELFLNRRLDDIDAALGTTLISGLELEWLSASSIRVKTGVAWVSGTGRLYVTSDITVTGISLGNNAWGHVYLYAHATTGAATIEVVTTAPVLYAGTAYQKTGNATRRYLGSVRTDAAGNIFNFIHQGDTILYRLVVSSTPHRCLNGGTNTTETTVSLAAVVPVTAQVAEILTSNTATNSCVIYTGSSDDSAAGPPTSGIIGVSNLSYQLQYPAPLDGNRALTYWFSSAPSGAGYIDVLGYRFKR